MKPNHARRSIQGLTLIEVSVCLAIILLLAGLLLTPTSGGAKTKVVRIHCISNLKQIGLAYTMWAEDHGGAFPWTVTSMGTNSGTLEFASTSEVWRHFQAISNEVNIPRVLVCGADKERTRVADWNLFTNNSHLSYFIGLDASEAAPQAILSGDRNFAVSNRLLKGNVQLASETRAEWMTSIHNRAGNVALADSSVQQVSSGQLDKVFQTAFLSTTQSVLRFAFPQ